MYPEQPESVGASSHSGPVLASFLVAQLLSIVQSDSLHHHRVNSDELICILMGGGGERVNKTIFRHK